MFLSRSSFVRSVDERTKKLEINDVKLDAYFNGQLCGSHYVPRRYSGENYFMEEQIVRFTGRRIARLLEKPWTIAPSAQNPDGSLRYSHSDQEAYAYAGAKERWDAISRSLMAEADEIGRDEKGERPVIGEYLETLAALPMPAEVEDMQKPGGPKFGVLDVVVTWGKGNKDPPDYAYLVKPTPIRIDGCRSITTESIDLVPFEDLAAEVDNPKPQPTVQAEDLKVPISTSISGEDTLKPVSDIVHDFTTTAPPSATTPILPHEPPDPPPPTTKTTTVRPPKRPDPPTSPLPIETPIKRSRGPYYDVLTTRQTLSEEFALVESQAIGSPSAYLPRTRRRRSTTGLSSTAASSPLSSPPQSRQTTPAVGNLGTVEVTEPIQLGGSSRSSASVGRQMVKDGAENVGHHSPPLPRRTPVPAARRRDRTSTQPSAEMLGRAFTTPALSEDCVVTYTGKGIVRNIGAVRSGRFSERGVVMGTRFLVG